MPLDKITVVIPVHNRKLHTINCLNRLRAIDKSGIDTTIVVVDDGSNDGTSELIAMKYPEVTILQGDGNLWWSGATNKGVAYALAHGCDYVLTLNDDVQFRDDFLINLLKTVNSQDNSIACGVICDIDNRNKIISAGRYAKGFLGYNYSGYLSGTDIKSLPTNEYQSDVESGYAMLIPRDVFQKVGLFDAKRFPHHMGDMDFVLRARRHGYKVIINPRAFLYTKIGDNYFHNQIITKSMWSNLKEFFNIKSSVNCRTRFYFYWRHTPYYLGLISFFYFVLRMGVAFFCKLILPSNVLIRVMKKRIEV